MVSLLGQSEPLWERGGLFVETVHWNHQYRSGLAGEAVLRAAAAIEVVLVTFTKHGYLRYD